MNDIGEAAFGRLMNKRKSLAVTSRAVLFGCAVLATFLESTPSHAQALPTTRAPLSIAIFVEPSAGSCYEPGDIPAIKRLTAIEQDRINRQGGFDGRQLQLLYLDPTVENMRTALANPHTVAMIGLRNPALTAQGFRVRRIFTELGSDIEASAIPLLSDFSRLSDVFEKPNVFTMQTLWKDGRYPAIIAFIEAHKRPAIVSEGGSAIAEALKSRNGDALLVADHRLSSADGKATSIKPLWPRRSPILR